MSSVGFCLAALDEGVERVAASMPGLPRSEVLLVRLLFLAGDSLLDEVEAKLRPVALHDSDFRTLMMLYASANGTSTPGELAMLADQKPTNMTRIINLLCARELVKRSPATRDRRQVILTITAEGRRFVRKLLPPMFPRLIDRFSCLTSGERSTLERLLRKLVLHEPAGEY